MPAMATRISANMYLPYSGYNPPKFAIDAAKDALDRVECNQYSPTKVGEPMPPAHAKITIHTT